MQQFVLRTLKLIIPVLISFSFLNCNDDEVEEPKKLISEVLFLNRSSSELQLFLSGSGLNLPFEELKYNVDLYKVTYKTTYKDQEMVASGVVILPKTTDPVGMVSFQHGTLAAHDEAPSKAELSDGAMILYAGLGSLGFIGVIPDYLGFGSSESILHPYYDETSSAQCVIDLLKAARELAEKKSNKFNGRLFLAGYSEGGYVTMATHKSIEEIGLKNFHLISSFPASGGYDVKKMQEFFFDQDTYSQPFYMAYVAYSYKMTYDWSQPLSDYFYEPYASKIPNLFDGSKSGSEINIELSENISELVKAELLNGIDTDSKFSSIRQAFIDNSLTDWTPSIEMHMYHGNADTIVPYENSTSTYAQLLSNGASSNTIHFHTLEGADHGSGVAPYLEDFIPRLIEMK